METYTSATVYDALNRPIEVTDPGGNVNEYFYDRGGALKSVELNSDVYVQDIHYDAKGQRLSIWYGNATKTRYEYDELTFMLRRLLTVNLNTNDILLDLHYWYDAVGNITQIQDDAQQTLYFNNSVVAPTQKFTYDALYRLTEAKGRELIGTASFGSEDNWNDSAWKTTHKGNGSAVQNYTQQYTYDEVGNILQVQHIAGTGSYTRDYMIDSDSNRMEETQVGLDTYSYIYDTRGNMSEMPHLDNMKWNISNELYKTENGTMEAYYQYSGGQRIRKWVDKGSIKEERIYLGSFEIYRKFESSSLKVERQTVHVSDDSGRIAMLEKRTVGSSGDDNGTDALLTRYIYSNHLQSASLELDDNADIISYEEYHPYGTTSYQAMNTAINAVAKRYRYTGKERDEESGLYYHGARYYIPWLARWSAVDPMESKYAGMSPYNYAFNNPIIFNDPSGADPPIKSIISKETRTLPGSEIPGYNSLLESNSEGIVNAVYLLRYGFGSVDVKDKTTPLSEEYEKALSLFEGEGKYSSIKLSYAIVDVNFLNKLAGDNKNNANSTRYGRTEIIVNFHKDYNMKPMYLRDVDAKDYNKINNFQLVILLNQKIDTFTALITLIHCYMKILLTCC